MSDFPRKRAILIGVDSYRKVQKLQFCGKDVRDVGNAFRQSLQFKPEDIIEFTSQSTRQPERTEIIDGISEFLKGGVDPDELLVFFFSGHGMIDESDKKDYLLPIDALPNDLSETGLAVDLIARKLTKSGCKNIVMFIDACRELVGDTKGIKSVGAFSEDAIKRDGIVTFFSCDPKERSYEITEIQNSSFTHCLLEAIAKGDCPTVQAIDQHLRLTVPNVNKKYNKPLQLPFTIIQPAEKGLLAIFYSEIKTRETHDKYKPLFMLLSRLYVDNELNETIYNEAIVTLCRVRDSSAGTPTDKQRFTLIEKLLSGGLCGQSFEWAWIAVAQRFRGDQPPKDIGGPT